MNEITRRFNELLSRPPDPGLTAVAGIGAVYCSLGHRLHNQTVPWTAAVLVLDGRKTIWSGRQSIEFGPGEMFMLPSQMDISVENRPGPDSGRYLAACLNFPADMVVRVAAGLDAPAEPRPGLEHFRAGVDRPLILALAHLLDMAQALPDNRRLLALCREEILELIAERSECLPGLWQAATTWRSRCSALVGTAPGNNWSAAQVAEKLGVGERSLRRNLAAEQTGFRRILQDVRLGAGLGMLQSGGVNVGEAAYRCGYDSASRFAALFKDRFGVSPSEVLRFNAVSGQQLAES